MSINSAIFWSPARTCGRCSFWLVAAFGPLTQSGIWHDSLSLFDWNTPRKERKRSTWTSDFGGWRHSSRARLALPGWLQAPGYALARVLRKLARDRARCRVWSSCWRDARACSGSRRSTETRSRALMIAWIWFSVKKVPCTFFHLPCGTSPRDT